MPNQKIPLQIKAFTIALLGLILLSVWYTYHPQTCIAFVVGVFFSPIIIVIGAIYYIRTKDDKEDHNITITFRDIETKPITNDDSGMKRSEIKNKLLMNVQGQNIRREKSEQNLRTIHKSRFCPEKFELNSRENSAAELDLRSLEKLREISTSTVINPSQDKNKVPRQSSLRDAYEKVRYGGLKICASIKIGHKEFKHELDELINLFKCFSQAEKAYAKGYQGFLTKSNISRDENIVEVRSLTDEDLLFLTAQYKRGFQNHETLIVPEWNKLKESLIYIGETHLSCSNSIELGSVQPIEAMKSEYETNYQDIKGMKIYKSKAYKEANQAYLNLKTEHDILQKSLESTVKEYHTRAENRESNEVLLKFEMKARLTKLQLDSLKNKLSGAQDKLKDIEKISNGESDKISQFIRQWQEKKLKMGKTTFKSLIMTLHERLESAERMLSILIYPIEDPGNVIQNFLESDEEIPVVGEALGALRKGVYHENFKKERKTKKFFRSLKDKSHKLFQKLEGKENNENPVYANMQGSEQLGSNNRSKLDTYSIQYQQELQQYEDELAKGKDILNMIKSLVENQDKYIREKNKLLDNEFSDLKEESFKNYWKLIRRTLGFTKNLNSQLFERICTIERTFSRNFQILQAEADQNVEVIQKGLKNIGRFIKQNDESTSHHSLKKSFKRILNKHEEEAVPIAASTNFGSVQENWHGHGHQYTEGIFQTIESALRTLNQTIKKFRESSLFLRKDIIIAYLRCYSKQKEHFSLLVSEGSIVSVKMLYLKEFEKINLYIEDRDIASGLTMAGRQLEVSQTIASQNDQGLSFDSTDLNIQTEPSDVNQNSQMENFTEINEFENPMTIEDTFWLNKMLGVFILEWRKSEIFKEKMMKVAYKLFNKRKRQYLQQIQVKDFKMEPIAPEIRKITAIPCESTEEQFICDFEVVYKGGVFFEIETKLEPHGLLNAFSKDYYIAAQAKILLKKFYGRIRICWKTLDSGPSWFSMMGEPTMDIDITPLLGQNMVNMNFFPRAESILRNILSKKLRKMIYPNRKPIKFPLINNPLGQQT